MTIHIKSGIIIQDNNLRERICLEMYQTLKGRIVSSPGNMAEKRLEKKMVEGYKTTAKESLKFAESSFYLANEVLNNGN